MTILHIITHFDQGGAERVALNIAKSKTSDMEYHLVEVVRTSGDFRNRFVQECLESGIQIHTSPIINNKLAIVLFPFWFVFTMFKVRPNIIHSHTEIPDLSLYIWNKLFGWMFPSIQYVRTIHNTELWNDWKNIGKRVEVFFKRVHANIAISRSTQLYYQKAYGECPEIIYNGLAITKQESFDEIVSGKINILFAGRLEYQKGIDELVEIVTALEDDDRFVFHIVGNGLLKHKVEFLRDLPSVRLYDKIYGLSSYLSSFDYLFMPSNFEGLALMPIEASLAKLPTIINRCPGLYETLPENWPLAINNNSVADFLKIFQGIEQYDRKYLGEQAYTYAKENFSIDKMQKEYEKVYEEKINRQ